MCDDFCQTGAQHSAAQHDRAGAEVLSVVVAAPHVDPAMIQMTAIY